MNYQYGVNQLQVSNVPNAKYKTMLCRHYQATKQCAIGAKCQFAHGSSEQRQMNDPLPASALSAMTTVLEQPTVNKPPSPIFQIPCKYHVQNYCKNGTSCQYMHDPEPTLQQQFTVPPPPPPPEDPMKQIFTHIVIEMQQLFPQDDIIQKLKIAYDQVRAGNLIHASECIRSIIYAPERTQEEMIKYTTLYNQAVTFYNQLAN